MLLKKITLAILFVLLATNAFAEKQYIYIDSIGKVHPGQESGHTEKGDVVDIRPYDPERRPTQAELSRYTILVSDLTEEEVTELLERLVESGVTTKARRRKVTMTSLIGIKQEGVVDVKILKNNIVVKSIQL